MTFTFERDNGHRQEINAAEIIKIPILAKTANQSHLS